MKKILSLLLVAAMVLVAGMAAVAEEAAPAAVTELTVGANTVYLYAPASELPVCSTCTAPAFIVFGSAAYTAETAEAAAVASGLAKLAAQEGATVAFVNPQGEAWAEADAEVYGALAGMYTNSSTEAFTDGMTATGSILGESGRTYIYAEGAGADFVAANFIKTVKSTMTFPDGFSMEFDRTPTSVTLFNVSALPEAAEPADIAVAVVNGPEDAEAKLAAVTDKAMVATSDVTEGFDAAWIAENYKVISGAYRRQVGILLPMHDYEAEGIAQTFESFTLSDGSTVNYVVYHDASLNVAPDAEAVPLVLAFHGGGNTALFEAQASEWPEIAQKNGFIAVAVDLHFPNTTAAQTVELVDHLKETYPIDASRVYGSGFSMGSIKSWDLYEQFPTVFAGVAPMDGANMPGVDSYDTALESYNHDVITPVFYLGGQTSPLPEMANQEQKIIDRIAYAFATNQVAQEYAYDAEANQWWGVNGDVVYQVTDKVAFTDSTLTVNLFKSADGKCYTALADSSNQSHEVYARNSWAAWDFLSQFSRNEDGSIAISPVTYALASDDGSVADNSYNTAE